MLAKISPPKIKGALNRERLFNILDEARERPFVWIESPAGSGKTTLISSYLDSRNLKSLWYQVDEGDNDIATFFYYMGLAGRKVNGRKKKPLPLLTSEYLSGIQTFARRFFEDLFSRLKPPFSVVLDNYQELSPDSPLHDIICNGLTVAPAGITIFIISRTSPPAAMASLRVARSLSILGWQELRLQPSELREFVSLSGIDGLKDDEIHLLYDKTGGWIAGLILMLEKLKTNASERANISGNPPGEIFEYFAVEIFNRLDGQTQDFLLKTAFLPIVTVQTAGQITNFPKAGHILSTLNRNHFFTDRRRGLEVFYQYHPLFRDFLLNLATERFNRCEINQIRLKAAAILENEGRVEEAAELFREAEDWSGLIRIIMGHARDLNTQGRSAVLEKWITAVPARIRGESPWLLFWLGVSKLPFVPADSRKYFEKAYAIFSDDDSPSGIFLSWSGIAESFIYEWNDLSPLPYWIRTIERQLTRYSTFPSLEIEERVSLNFFVALFLVEPGHPNLPQWEKKVEMLMEKSESIGFRLMSGHYQMFYNVLTGNLARAERLYNFLHKLQDIAGPAERILANTIEAYYFWAKGYGEESLKAVEQGLNTSHETGVYIWSFSIASMRVYTGLISGNPTVTESYFKDMERFTDKRRGLDTSHYHYLRGWQALMMGEAERALEYSRGFLRNGGKVPLFFDGFSSVAAAMIFFALGNSSEAHAEIKRAREIAERGKSARLEFHILIVEAERELLKGSMPEGTRLLAAAFALGRKCQIFNMDWWLPDVMVRLCIIALEHGIETAYVQEFIRRHGLFPVTPPLKLENWPWAVKIYTLGDFIIELDGLPLTFSGKAQKKPLELLQALIALGGENVKDDQITDLLWPEADGDMARQSYRAAVSRLRRLLRHEKAIVTGTGKIGLNRCIVWVDIWAFERAMETDSKEEDSAIHTEKPPVSKLFRTLEQYSDEFLCGCSWPWVLPMRKGLKNRALNAIMDLGSRLEDSGEMEWAIKYYRKGLEIDPLVEGLYQKLIDCYGKLGRGAEAVHIFNSCREKFLSELGIHPSEQTVEILKRYIDYITS